MIPSKMYRNTEWFSNDVEDLKIGSLTMDALVMPDAPF